MKISRQQLQEIIYRTLNLINEGMSQQQLDKLLGQVSNNMYWNDYSAHKIQTAYDSGIQKKPQIEWLVNFFIQYPKNAEPIGEIVKTMKDFNRFNAKIKNLGLESDMTKYETPGDLRSSVMRSQGKVSNVDLAAESTHLGKFGAYDLYMPHTKEASCTLGEDTVWCTAVTGKGNNLFYNYVARKNSAEAYGGDVFLFYLILDEMDYRSQNTPSSYKAMSLGYVGNEIKFASSFDQGGGLTVDAKNNGLTERIFSQIVGGNTADAIEVAINNHINKLSKAGKQHPAKEKFKKLANNPALLKQELQGSSLEVKEDTLSMIRDIHKSPPPTAEEMEEIDQRQGFQYWGNLPKYMPQYPPAIKDIIFKEVQKIFYKRIEHAAKKAYELSDMYTSDLLGFQLMVEHPEGDMLEDRYASVIIYEEIRKQEMGVNEALLFINKEYFSIIRKAGLELVHLNTKEVIQPEDVSPNDSDSALHTSDVSIIKKDSKQPKISKLSSYFM